MSQGPIFINGFSRGGTTMLANILASHPNVCYLGETHHIFKGHRHTDSTLRIIWKSLSRDLPAILFHHENVFSPRLIRPRRPVGESSANRLRRRLVTEKKHSLRYGMYSKFKTARQSYTVDEISTARLMTKNVDGMIFATDMLATAFPDATFIGLIRDGFALCEGHLRRGRSADELGRRYRVLTEKMLSDAEQLVSYHFFKFEDLIANPTEVAKAIYKAVGLDPQAVTQIRMQRRRVMDANGNHRLVDGGEEWSVEWLDWQELSSYCRADVNRNQVGRLSPADRESFIRQAGDTMRRLGYLTAADTAVVDSRRSA